MHGPTRRLPGLLGLLAPLAAACGDNQPGTDSDQPDASGCATRADYPGGLLGSPDDLPPLPDCVPWTALTDQAYFVRDEPITNFGFAYPRLSYACATGLTYNDYPSEFVFFDDSLGFVRYGGEFEGGVYAVAEVMCPQADGGIAMARATCVLEDGAPEPECWDQAQGAGQPYERLGPLTTNVTLRGAYDRGEALLDVDVKGDRAYVAGTTWLGVFDLSGDGLPLLGELTIDVESINDIEVVELGGQRIAYVGAAATQIVDVTDPAAMVNLGSIDLSGRDPYAHTVQIGQRGEQTLLFLGGQDHIPVYDVSVPTDPAYLTSVPLDSPGTHDMTIAGDLIYVNNEFSGFVALDASDLAAPITLATRPSDYYDHASAVGAAGGRALVVEGGEGLDHDGDATHLRIYDGDPASKTYMTQLGEYATRASTGIHNMTMRGDYVYIAYYQDGLRIVDLADPTAPVEVAHYNSWDRASPNRGPFAGAIGIDLTDSGDVILLNYEGQVLRLRPTLPR